MSNDQTITCLCVLFNNMTFLLYICATYFGTWNWVFLIKWPSHAQKHVKEKKEYQHHFQHKSFQFNTIFLMYDFHWTKLFFIVYLV
jgi:hypothetical protein